MDRNRDSHRGCVQPDGVTMKYLSLLPLFLLANCSSLEVVGDAVERYCELSTTQRLANREAIADIVAPNTIEIGCADNAEEGS